MEDASKVTVVTGGVTGIGRAIVEASAQQGWVTVICDVDATRGPKVERELVDRGLKVIFKPCNVTDESQVRAVIKDIETKYDRIDNLVNNAGIIRRRKGPEINCLRLG